MSNSVTLGWFGVLKKKKNKLQLNKFLLFILILAILSKFPNFVAFLFKQICNYFILSYIKFGSIF